MQNGYFINAKCCVWFLSFFFFINANFFFFFISLLYIILFAFQRGYLARWEQVLRQQLQRGRRLVESRGGSNSSQEDVVEFGTMTPHRVTFPRLPDVDRPAVQQPDRNLVNVQADVHQVPADQQPGYLVNPLFNIRRNPFIPAPQGIIPAPQGNAAGRREDEAASDEEFDNIANRVRQFELI